MILLPDDTCLTGEVTGLDCKILSHHPQIKSECEAFLARPICIRSTVKSIYVTQGEFAEVSLQDEAIFIGSSDATTCIITVLVDLDSNKATVAHHDETTIRNIQNTNKLLEGMSQASLYMVGGFSDAHGVGNRVLLAVLSALAAASIPITLRLFGVASFNTEPINGSPRCQSLAVNLRDPLQQQAYPVIDWRDRGPLLSARMAQMWFKAFRTNSGNSLVPIYSPKNNQIELVLTHGELEHSTRAFLEEMLRVDDTEFLWRCSTSPEFELEHIAMEMRESFRWILESCGPLIQNKLIFKWEEGGRRGWVEVAQRREKKKTFR